jgi:hypothetical protein
MVHFLPSTISLFLVANGGGKYNIILPTRTTTSVV